MTITRDDQRADVGVRDVDAGDGELSGGERARELVRFGAVAGAHRGLERDRQAEGGDHQRDDAVLDQRVDDQLP